MSKSAVRRKESEPVPALEEGAAASFRVWPHNLELAEALVGNSPFIYDRTLDKRINFEGSIDDVLNQLICLGALYVKGLRERMAPPASALENLKNIARFLMDNPESEMCAGLDRRGVFKALAHFEAEAAVWRRVSLAVAQNEERDNNDKRGL